jgi:hypothetical protein
LVLIRKQTALPILMLALVTVGVAQTDGASKVYRDGNSWVEEMSGSVPASRLIKIHTNVGSVSVTGAQQSNIITYTIRKRVNESSEQGARRAFENLRVLVTRQGEAVFFAGEGSNWHRGSVEFNITAPRNLEAIKAKTDGGSLQFSHLNGRVDAESGGGSIHLDDINGSVTTSTGGGGIDVGTLNADLGIRTGGGQVHITSVAGKLSATTGGGNVYVQTAKRDAILETGGGNISVQNVGGDLRGSTGGGNIEVGGVAGTMDVETGGGSIRLTGGGTGPIKAQTGSGSIHCVKIVHSVRAETGAGGITAEFMTMNGKFSDSTLETGVGDIIVYLPSDLKVSIHASIDVATAKDAIRTDFPGLRIQSEGDYGPREMFAEGDLNGGGPSLKLHTSTGKIQFIALKK